jgi:inhibitor of KinA sporulation pathway (predicted exonuclease)
MFHRLTSAGLLQVTSGEDIDRNAENEIIEFPWVVFDLTTNQIAEDKQLFVKPSAHPELNDATTRKATKLEYGFAKTISD